MNITFYFDPSCPFCWITSRWLLLVSQHRSVEITLNPFSLALKNNELRGDKTEHSQEHRESHRVLRVMLAAQQKFGTSMIDLYSTATYQRLIAGKPFNDRLIQDLLIKHSLAQSLLEDADNTKYDSTLQNYIDEATEISGQDIGVPFIVFESSDSKTSGFFGPVLQAMPSTTDALKLWDGLTTLATDPNFYELKRTRPPNGPDVKSTVLPH